MNDKIYIFDFNKEWYLFNCITYNFLRIPDDLTTSVIYYVRQNRIAPGDNIAIKNLIDFLRVNREFFNCKVDIHENSPKMPIFSFCPAHNCNFKCRYCFAKNEKVYSDTKISQKMVDAVFDYMLSRFNQYNAFRLEFVSGGEPLLNFEAVKHACNLSHNLKKNGIEINILLVTNASLLTDDILEFFESNNVFLGISFDGTEKYQNSMRLMKNGDESYSIVAEKINRIKSSKKLVNTRNNLWIISVITSCCDSLVDIIKNLLCMGVKSAELRVARGNEEEGLFLNAQNIDHFIKIYDELCLYIIENIKKDIYDPLLLILNNYDTLGKLIKRLMCGNHVLYRCNAGVFKFAFTATGDIYPCDSFVGLKEFKIGNIMDNERRDSAVREPVSARNQCDSCYFEYICGGDCYYNSFVNNKDTKINGTAYCLFMKELCAMSIKILFVLKDNSKKYKEIKHHLMMRDYFNNY